MTSKGLNKLIMMNCQEILSLIKDNKFTSSFFLNGKRMSGRKISNVIDNNISKDVKFIVKSKRQTLPFYKGDFLYYKNMHNNPGLCRIKKNRFYITVVNG